VTTSLVHIQPGLLALASDGGRPDPEAVEAAAGLMAAEYAEATAALRRHLEGLHEQAQRLERVFAGSKAGDSVLNNFQIDARYDGTTVYRRYCREDEDPYRELFQSMKRRAWEMLVNHLGIKNFMSVKKRKEFEDKLMNGDLPEIDRQAILDVIFGLVDQARDFAAEAAREVFDILRPSRTDYKTNSAFRVGRRVILSWYVDEGYGRSKFRANYHREQELRAIDGVFHLLDGKGPIREYKTPLLAAIENSPDGKGETVYFRFRCFKNRNLHLEFKRLDLVKQLNGIAAGEYVLGADAD
jgi:hypothetical protein